MRTGFANAANRYREVAPGQEWGPHPHSGWSVHFSCKILPGLSPEEMDTHMAWSPKWMGPQGMWRVSPEGVE